MFQDLLKMLRGELPPEPITGDDSQIAIAALMVRVARADDSYDSVERDMIEDVLIHHYDMTREEATEMRLHAEKVEAEAADTVRFTRVLKEAVPYEERDAIAEALWRVALADNDRSEDENALLRTVVGLLGISDRDSGLARQRAEQSLQN